MRIVLKGITICFVLIAAFSFRGALASEESDQEATDPFMLEEVVVTGTRTEKLIQEAPVRTQVVTKEEIERINATDLKEALEDVPGIVIKETVKNGYSVWMQGFDSDRVLVLINGRRVAATTGTTVDLTQISTANIERIEIVKGAVSALYGSEAMGGVVNVITKTPLDPYSLTVQVDAGTFLDKNLDDKHIATEHFLVDFNVNKKKWSFQLFSNLRLFEGFDLDDSDPTTNGDEGYRLNLDGRLAYIFEGGSEIYFLPRYYKEKKKIRFTTFTPGLGDLLWERRENGDLINMTVGSDIIMWDGSRLQSSAYFQRFHDVSKLDILASDPLEVRREAEIDYMYGEFQWDKLFWDNHLITLGGLIGKQTLEQDQVQEEVNEVVFVEEIEPGAEQKTVEVFVQDDFFAKPWLEVLPGVRYQYDSGFGSYLAPKLNILLTPLEDTNIRVGYGKGYRVPNLKERFFFFDHSALGYIVLGNPDLEPEKSDSFQLGADGVWRKLRWDVNFFFNRVKDLIDVQLDEELSEELGLQVFRYTNVRRAILFGAEIAGTYNLLRFINLRGGYAYLWARDTDLDKFLTNRPQHQIKGGFDLLIDRVDAVLSLRAIYQSKEYVDEENTITSPAWTTVDVIVNKYIGERYRVFAGVDNVFDVHRNPSNVNDLRPVIGRYIYAGVRIDLDWGNKL